MALKPYFKNRASRAISLSGSIKFDVNMLEWSVYGGAEKATITASGDKLALWQLTNWLRYAVEIIDEKSRVAWAGYVSEVVIRAGRYQIGVSIEAMSNKVAVRYCYVEPGTNIVGNTKTTGWAENTESTAEFGTKEFLYSAAGMTDEAAESLRDTILELRGVPNGVVDYIGGDGEITAAIICRGWWNTLDWRMASVDYGYATSYIAGTTTTYQDMGNNGTASSIFQQVTMVGGINASRVSIYGYKVGTAHADDFQFRVMELANGTPIAAIGSVSVSPSSFGTATTGAWVTGTITSDCSLQNGATYGLEITRTGAVNSSNYYKINMGTALGYDGGSMGIYNGTSYVTRSPDADMPFSIAGNMSVDTGQQIYNLITQYGDYAAAVEMDFTGGTTGSYSGSYQDGRVSAKTAVRTLMDAGGPNGRRLLAAVDYDRRFRVYEEPSSASPKYKMDANGKITSLSGMRLPEHLPPIGSWVMLDNFISPAINMSSFGNPTLQFLEGGVWTQLNGFVPRFKGNPTASELARYTRLTR